MRPIWSDVDDPVRRYRALRDERQSVDESGAPPGTPIPRLTCRERQVLELVAEGWKSADIAARLTIGTRTVETHRTKLMRKLGVHSAAAMVRAAMWYRLLRI